MPRLLSMSFVAAVALFGAVHGGESLRPPAPSASGVAAGQPSATPALRPATAREYVIANSITSSGSLILDAAAPVPRKDAAPAGPSQSDLDFLSTHGLPADAGRQTGPDIYGIPGIPHVPGASFGSDWDSAPGTSSASLFREQPRLPPESRGELMPFGDAPAPASGAYAPRPHPPSRTVFPDLPALPAQPPPQPARSYDPLPRRLAEMSQYERIAMQPYPDYDTLSLHEKARLYTRQFVLMRNRRPAYSPETIAAIRRSEAHGVPREELYGGLNAHPNGSGPEVRMENLRTKGLTLPKRLLTD